METIEVFCPATIANLNCGFDVLGLALDEVGDLMRITKSEQKGIRIISVRGEDIPLDPEKNVAGVTANSLLSFLGSPQGFSIEIQKGIRPGSGIGSSAASAAGAAWAINELLGKPLSQTELVRFAMEGERLASGVAHADNVAPALMGGITLIRSYDPLDIIRLPVPEELYVTVIHPHIEIRTSDSRKLLKTTFPLSDGIRQWGNLGGLVAGLYTSDYELIGRSLHDHIVEPIRSILIPGFPRVKDGALKAGALGFGISGSGPSLFALCRGEVIARKVGQAMIAVYQELDLPSDLYSSPVSLLGVHQKNKDA